MRAIIILLSCIAVVCGLVIHQDGSRQTRRLDSNEWDATGQQQTDPDSSENEQLAVVPLNSTSNTTAQNLYVIKAVVYEIGILTDVDENDTTTNETLKDEQIDFTFFNPERNGSTINLGNIPLPIQTNISGQVITGLAPVNLGTLSTSQVGSLNSTDGLSGLLSFADSLSHLTPTISINKSDDDNHIKVFNGSISDLEIKQAKDEPKNSTTLTEDNSLPVTTVISPLPLKPISNKKYTLSDIDLDRLLP